MVDPKGNLTSVLKVAFLVSNKSKRRGVRWVNTNPMEMYDFMEGTWVLESENLGLNLFFAMNPLN